MLSCAAARPAHPLPLPTTPPLAQIANNAFTAGSEQHNDTLDGPWEDRVTAAVRAYHEYLPTRYFMDDGAYTKTWRTLQFGDLATLVMLETRLSARTDPDVQPDVFGSVGKLGFVYPPAMWSPAMVTGLQAYVATLDAYRNQPDHVVVGPSQLRFVKSAVAKSAAAGTTWQLLGQDTVMLEQFAPDFEKAIAAQRDPVTAARWRQAYTNLTDALNHTTAFDTSTAYLAKYNGVPIPVTQDMKFAARVIQAMGQYRCDAPPACATALMRSGPRRAPCRAPRRAAPRSCSPPPPSPPPP